MIKLIHECCKIINIAMNIKWKKKVSLLNLSQLPSPWRQPTAISFSYNFMETSTYINIISMSCQYIVRKELFIFIFLATGLHLSQIVVFWHRNVSLNLNSFLLRILRKFSFFFYYKLYYDEYSCTHICAVFWVYLKGKCLEEVRTFKILLGIANNLFKHINCYANQWSRRVLVFVSHPGKH